MAVSVWKFSKSEKNYELSYIDTSSSLDEASGKLAQGVYTTFRTYQHSKALRLDDHFSRLERSAALHNRDLHLDRLALRLALRDILNAFPGSDVRIRIHSAYEDDCYQLYFMAEAFMPYPEDLYKTGVSVRTYEYHRENPESKATNFITQTREIRAARPHEIHEYIMVGDSGEILEGLTCNIFLLRNRHIWTADTGILPGITREIVLEVVSDAGLDVRYGSYPLIQIHQVDEIFITSTSRGVLPVTEFDGEKVGNGDPGVVTLKIRSLFERRLQEELQLI